MLREIVNYYPAGFDQASFLTVLYQASSEIKKHGLIYALQHAQVLATGPFFMLQAIVFVWLFGATRFNLLLINFLYFVAFQLFTLMAVRSLSKSYRVSLLFLGLILGLHTSFGNGGGMADFRMDFIAMTLYGIVLAFVIKSKIFLDRKWVVCSTFFMILLILMRGISSVYLLGALSVIYIYFSIKLYKSPRDDFYSLIKIKLHNLLGVFLIVLLVSTAYISLNWNALYNYYAVNHIFGVEKEIRALMEGVVDLKSNVLYYPHSLVKHFGGLDLALIGFSSIVFSILYYATAKLKTKFSLSSKFNFELIFVLMIFLCMPLFILSLDMAKSSVVSGIAVGPLLWLVTWPFYSIDQRIFSRRSISILNALAITVFVVGFYQYCHKLSKDYYSRPDYYSSKNAVKEMNLAIGDYALAKGWSSIRMSVDGIYDYICSGSLVAQYFETKGIFINAAPNKMGGMIFKITLLEALESIKESDVVIFTNDRMPKTPYPLTNSIQDFKPKLFPVINQRFVFLDSFMIYGHSYQVYVRP